MSSDNITKSGIRACVASPPLAKMTGSLPLAKRTGRGGRASDVPSNTVLFRSIRCSGVQGKRFRGRISGRFVPKFVWRCARPCALEQCTTDARNGPWKPLRGRYPCGCLAVLPLPAAFTQKWASTGLQVLTRQAKRPFWPKSLPRQQPQSTAGHFLCKRGICSPVVPHMTRVFG